MSSAPSPFPFEEIVHRVVPRVIFTMLEVEATPVFDVEVPKGEKATAVIGIGSDTVEGTIYFHLSLNFSKLVARKLLEEALGRPAEDEEMQDVVGELCKMVSGGLKSTMANMGIETAMSPPSIIRGKSFSVEASSEMEVSHFFFSCENEILELEVHLKL